MLEKEAEQFLQPIADKLVQCFQNALLRVISIDPSLILDSTKRTRSSLLNDLFYAEIERSGLTDNKFFRPNKIRGLRVFNVINGNKLLTFRLKKLFGKRLLGLNNNTAQTNLFQSQYPLEGQGFYTEVSNIVIGYKSDTRAINFTIFATSPLHGYNSWILNLGTVNVNNLQQTKVASVNAQQKRTNKLKINLPNVKSI